LYKTHTDTHTDTSYTCNYYLGIVIVTATIFVHKYTGVHSATAFYCELMRAPLLNKYDPRKPKFVREKNHSAKNVVL